MYFESFADFLAMGRHGLYVWMAYGFFLLILVWNILSPRLAARHAVQRARKYWQRRNSQATSEANNETN